MGSDSRFATTRWTLVIAAAGDVSTGSREALAELCERYWTPLYAYARRHGYDVPQAQDLTQAFFARLLEKGDLRAADPSRGKFRSFLISSFKHFVSNVRDHDRALKRGGGQPHLQLEFDTAEARYQAEPAASTLTPEELFERQWAVQLVERVRAQLAAERERAGAGEQFARLAGFLNGDPEPGGYEELARDTGTTEGALRVTVHRLRRRFRELLRAEIAATVSDDSEIEGEIRHLISALSG